MAYAYVQTSTWAYPAVFSSTVAGNALVALVHWSDSANTEPTLDGGTWIPVGTKVTNGSNYSSQLFYMLDNPGGITTVGISSWSNGTPGEYSIVGSEYSGIATSGAFIVHAGQVQTSPGTGTDAMTSGNGDISSQPALVWGAHSNHQSLAVNSGTGFTSRFDTTGCCVEDKRITSTGNQAATFTAESAPSNVNTMMIALAEAGSGPTAAFIRENLVDKSGGPVASETGITLMVWYAVPSESNAAPDEVIDDVETDSSGDIDVEIALGDLEDGDPVWIALVKDGTPPRATLKKTVVAVE